MELDHITFQGPPIDDAEILEHLPDGLRELLSQLNGFIQFHGGLHIRGACTTPDWHSLREAWMGNSAFYKTYPAITEHDIPFGQDCVGDQFFLRSGSVIHLQTETGDLKKLDLTFSEFLEEAQRNPVSFLMMQPLMQHQINASGGLAPGQLLSVYPHSARWSPGMEFPFRRFQQKKGWRFSLISFSNLQGLRQAKNFAFELLGKSRINMLSDLDKISAIRAAMPAEGLFADKEWMISPEPFAIDERLHEELQKLGHRLNLFNRACNLLYHMSVQCKQPRWVADYLDAGKPPELVEYARQKKFRDDIPRIIRPDIILTEHSPDKRPAFTIAELDTVPGGIGLTAWLNQTYSTFGTHHVIGGPDGMIEGFRSLLPDGGDIIISEESATYHPEMNWLAKQLRDRGVQVEVRDAATYNPNSTQGEAEGRGQQSKIQNPKSIYRFFELFDLPNIPGASAILSADLHITPPIKPYLEEKMWFALFWMRPLREFWRRELGEKHFLRLQEFIPYTWIIDPMPIPQHAVIPELEINSWDELAHFSQKHRDLIMKISGFSELAWGSRGVSLGADMPQQEWKAAIDRALGHFKTHPRILQRFHKGRIVHQRYLNPATGQIETLQGRVRLCPFYFIIDGKAELRGILSTLCPPDKKLLHGMKDAILSPVQIVAD